MATRPVHVLHVFINEEQLHSRMVLKLFEVRRIVAGVNAVRDNTGTTYVVL